MIVRYSRRVERNGSIALEATVDYHECVISNERPPSIQIITRRGTMTHGLTTSAARAKELVMVNYGANDRYRSVVTGLSRVDRRVIELYDGENELTLIRAFSFDRPFFPPLRVKVVGVGRQEV